MHALTPANDLRASEPEALLIRRAADGDARAFSDLARMLVRPALAQAVRILGDRALAEDAVQDAFARLWREAGRFDPERGSFAAWWRRLLVNCALDGRRRLRPVAPIEEAADIADAGPTPAGAAESADLAARVQAAAAALPERQRAALALFHGEGLSMAEIAETLETSEKAVEGLLLRARATLKTRLDGLKGELQ
ncbi:sigma-70 family RNA polymerase sigma factor [Sandaracinobacter sp. RS1-74]|uniref:RNA polymerase sigma factor n=1 Tax=Sandaracinobacteroides sayramensis TaxID=2913411 RepID=UPI001EDC3CD5|nr:sigma-70 family RNA polymerase sigma factor [Sandaracinobacteroides sayramensis]MCG2840222.1 sigma-70 family RNA polymerase sigma factor [Sandaracinobacteroides sayramensis]